MSETTVRKYEVGDRVRVTSNPFLAAGATGEVVELCGEFGEGLQALFVNMDNWSEPWDFDSGAPDSWAPLLSTEVERLEESE